MKVVNIDKPERVPASGALFIGSVERQALVGENEAQQLRLNIVRFKDGAVNKFHSHSFDQVLLITEGEGIVQKEGEAEQRVRVGDLILIPAGERHWHGAAPGQTMAHMTVATPGKTEM